jgi:hypothetical protein
MINFDCADLGASFGTKRIVKYELLYWEDEPKSIRDLRIFFDDGCVLDIDESFLEDVKEAIERKLSVFVEYKVEVNNYPYQY